MTRPRVQRSIGRVKILPKFFVPLLCASAFTLVLNVAPVSGQQELDEAKSLNQQVVKLYQAGKYAEAIPLAQRALAIREKALGPAHPKVAKSFNDLAALYQAMGDSAKAEALYQRAQSIKEKPQGQ